MYKLIYRFYRWLRSFVHSNERLRQMDEENFMRSAKLVFRILGYEEANNE